MKILTKLLFTSVLTTSLLSVSCSKDDGGSGTTKTSGSNVISEQSVAEELARIVRSSLSSLDDAVSVNFSSPQSVKGTSGTVTVSGTKTHTENTYSSGGSSYDVSSFTSLSFTSFTNDPALIFTSGTGSYSYSYDSSWRTAGAFSYHINVSYKLNSCKVAFTYNSIQYKCSVNIDYSTESGTHGRGYTATVKVIDSGKEFSIYGFD